MQPSPGGPGTVPGPPAPAPQPAVAERARRLGPLPYSSLGMRPAAGPAAPAEVAAWATATVDLLWERAGRPDPFTVAQVAAGDGSVAAAMLHGDPTPACAAALRLVLVEADPFLREVHAARLPVESPAIFLGPVTVPDDPDEDPRPATGIGPVVTSLAEQPVVRGPCAVLAVGWLSRFPYDLFEWRGRRWHEVRLAAASDSGPDLEAITVELDADRASRLDSLADPARRADGSRYALRDAATAWLRGATGSSDSGWVVAADRWTDRTAPLPYDGVVPVALDQLSVAQPPEAAGDAGPAGLEVVRWRIG